jgi:WD40 repeat protein
MAHTDGTVQQWNAETFEEIGEGFTHAGVNRAEYGSVDHWLLTVRDKDYRFRRLRDGEERRFPLARSGSVFLAGDNAVVANHDHLETWSLKGDEPEKIGEPLQIGSPILDVGYSRNRSFLAVVAEETVELWDAGLKELVQRLDRLGEPSSVVSIAVAERGDALAVATESGIETWTAGAEHWGPTIPESAVQVVLSSDSSLLVTVDATAHVRVWDARERTAITELTPPIDLLRCKKVNDIAFDLQGAVLAVGCEDKAL